MGSLSQRYGGGKTRDFRPKEKQKRRGDNDEREKNAEAGMWQVESSSPAPPIHVQPKPSATSPASELTTQQSAPASPSVTPSHCP